MADSNLFKATYKYGEAEAAGEKWQKWLDDPSDDSCIITPIRLSMSMLRFNYGWYIFNGSFPLDINDASRYYPPSNLKLMLRSRHLSTGRKYTRVVLRQRRRSSKSGCGTTRNDYVLQTGPGVICALDSRRIDGPHWSDIAIATYRKYETEDLRYVFRVNVNNPVTTATVCDIYLQNGLPAPDARCRAWCHGTPEYQAILSTPNARGVSALVLGGFERGTKWIPTIITWADTTYACSYLQIVFVIRPR
ncbi:hypothetical protein N7466_011449 [Penicillium verhagenii]|uniref:uncharacterized protein n=1 Tax=Penicillium verhagenii TaxID=1562060 RepID=UPI002545226C|nr:uncharacterized protein N7466_011449 [Penicillium verhagenii]KAJ5915516.1 hypothetical protein N7466_011449 [Penicillium verhagenii]